MNDPIPTLPDYGARCTTGIVPALTHGVPTPLLPDEVLSADASVLLVLDSLGWEQMNERSDSLHTLTKLSGGVATTVAPSTTAAALTSISTGTAPGEHGIVGYRFPAGGAVMNALRWTSTLGDHRQVVSPRDLQPIEPFAGGEWSVVSGRQFIDSGFSETYLGALPYVGYEHPSSIVAEVRGLLDGGSRLVYAYYDGLDHVAHIHGVSSVHFDMELGFCDWLVGQLVDGLPSGTAVVVTADHGQLDAPRLVELGSDVDRLVTQRSGEPRFRWLHAVPGAEADLLETAREMHGHSAWVLETDQLVADGWFGPTVTSTARSRLGDVALIAHEPIGFADPAEAHANRLVGRHGSVTSAEMLVPVLHTIV